MYPVEKLHLVTNPALHVKIKVIYFKISGRGGYTEFLVVNVTRMHLRESSMHHIGYSPK